MSTYNEPEIEIIYFEVKDIITTSPVDVPEELPIQPYKWDML
jgi:hypothetical protein